MNHLFVLLVFAINIALPAMATETSPAGLWRSFNSGTKEPNALIRVTEVNGELTARVEKLFVPAGQDPNPICGHCEGERKGKPVQGMIILWGLKKDGDVYVGGQVFEPFSGKSYKSKVSLKAGGAQLSVLGYIGLPMMGRSQVWEREK